MRVLAIPSVSPGREPASLSHVGVQQPRRHWIREFITRRTGRFGVEHLPIVFILGIFSSVRLIDTSAQNMVALHRIEVIRCCYASIQPNAPAFFAPDRSEEGIQGVRYRGQSILFTVASMIIVVDSVVRIPAAPSVHFQLALGPPQGAAAICSVRQAGRLTHYYRFPTLILPIDLTAGRFGIRYAALAGRVT